MGEARVQPNVCEAAQYFLSCFHTLLPFPEHRRRPKAARNVLLRDLGDKTSLTAGVNAMREFSVAARTVEAAETHVHTHKVAHVTSNPTGALDTNGETPHGTRAFHRRTTAPTPNNSMTHAPSRSSRDVLTAREPAVSANKTLAAMSVAVP